MVRYTTHTEDIEMAKMTVRSFVSIEIEIDTSIFEEDMTQEDIVDMVINEAGNTIGDKLMGLDFDFFEDAIVYDEDGEEIAV
jgi:hypothetical protein